VSIEFIGMIQTRKVSETHAAQGPVAFQSLLEGLVEAEPDVHS
jgi:alkanesulfonate monooxygenase